VTLLLGIIISSCSKSSSTPPPPVDKLRLQRRWQPQTLYTGTIEGTKPGQYESGSRTAYKTVVDAATAVLNDATSTQADITNAAPSSPRYNYLRTHLIKNCGS
jgi:hypothetical protein